MSLGKEQTLTIDGEAVPVRLTLGALAEIEELLGAETLSDLATMLASPSVRQILAILPVLVSAGGDTKAAARVGEGTVHLGEALKLITVLFRELISGELPGKPKTGVQDGAPG